MFRSLSTRVRTLSSDVRAMAGNHWDMLKEELAGNAKLTKRQLVFLAAGAAVALTGVILLLTCLTLLLSLLLVSMAGMEPLTAVTVGTGVMALIFSVAGAVLVVRAAGKLGEQKLTPVHTLNSLGASLQTLAAAASPSLLVEPAAPEKAPLPPNNITPPASQPLVQETSLMETNPTPTAEKNGTATGRQQTYESSGGPVPPDLDESVRRVKQNLGETLYNMTQKIDIHPLAAAAIDWLTTYLDNRGRSGSAGAARAATASAFGGSGSTNTEKAAHLSPLALGLAGLGYLLWQQLSRPAARETASDAVNYGREQARRAAERVRESCQSGAEAIHSAGHQVRETVGDTVHRWADAARSAGAQTASRARDYYDQARETAEEGVDHLKKNLEEGYEHTRDFARERPVAAAAAGVLAVGLAAWLVQKAASRR